MRRKAKPIQNFKMHEKYSEAEFTLQKVKSMERNPDLRGGKSITQRAEGKDKEIKDKEKPGEGRAEKFHLLQKSTLSSNRMI